MSLWARSWLPIPPGRGCLAPGTPFAAQEGDRSSDGLLERDPWAARQEKHLASVGVHGQLPVQDGDRDGDGLVEGSEEAKASIPCLRNGGHGKVERIPQTGIQRVTSMGTASPNMTQVIGISSPGQIKNQEPQGSKGKMCLLLQHREEEKHHRDVFGSQQCLPIPEERRFEV